MSCTHTLAAHISSHSASVNDLSGAVAKIVGLFYTHNLTLYIAAISDLHNLVLGMPGCGCLLSTTCHMPACTHNTPISSRPHAITELHNLLHAAYSHHVDGRGTPWPVNTMLLVNAANAAGVTTSAATMDTRLCVVLPHTAGCCRLLDCTLHTLATCSSTPAPCTLPCHALSTTMVATLCDLAGCGQQRVEQAALAVVCGYAARRPDSVPLPQVLQILQAMGAAVGNAQQRASLVDPMPLLDVPLHMRLVEQLCECVHACATRGGATTVGGSAVCRGPAVHMASEQLVHHLALLLPHCHPSHGHETGHATGTKAPDATATDATATDATAHAVVAILQCMRHVCSTLPLPAGVAGGITVALGWWLREPPARAMQPQVVTALVGALHAAARCTQEDGVVHGVGGTGGQGEAVGEGRGGGSKRRRVSVHAAEEVVGTQEWQPELTTGAVCDLGCIVCFHSVLLYLWGCVVLLLPLLLLLLLLL